MFHFLTVLCRISAKLQLLPTSGNSQCIQPVQDVYRLTSVLMSNSSRISLAYHFTDTLRQQSTLKNTLSGEGNRQSIGNSTHIKKKLVSTFHVIMGSPAHTKVQVGRLCHSWYQHRKFATSTAHYLRNTLATIREALMKVSLPPSSCLLVSEAGKFGPEPNY